VRTLVYGAKGYLGQQFLTLLPNAVASEVDIADSEAVADELDRIAPDMAINCAGKTGRPNVDWCEDHKQETLMANVLGPLVLLKELGARSVYWVHLGSGCIYQGDNGGPGFSEDDPPNFSGSFYSRTKGWSDGILKEFPVLNLRLRMPFDGTDNPRSLLTKLAKYSRVLDAENSLTYLPDFFTAALTLIERRKTGTYNMVNPGVTTPYHIMLRYKEIVDPSHSFERLAPADLPEVAKAARSSCILNTAKLEGEGIAFRPVDEAIDEALRSLAAGRRKT
jgi:dTDP-4-dehydrorhamnose reductase